MKFKTEGDSCWCEETIRPDDIVAIYEKSGDVEKKNAERGEQS